MFEAAIFLLSACAVTAEQSQSLTTEQLDDLYVSFEATPSEILLGDVVFARISVINRGNMPVRLPPRFLREFQNLNLYLIDRKRETRKTLSPYLHVRLGEVRRDAYREVRPGERWLLGYFLLEIPPLKCTEWPFWNPQTLSKEPYVLYAELKPIIGSHCSCGNAGPLLKICPRPEAEMAQILQLYHDRPMALSSDRPAYFEDRLRPRLNLFYSMNAPLECSLPKNLATMENVLSPGSLREIVHLTRLSQAVYDEKSIELKRKNLDDLLGWLETLPEIERKWMAKRVVRWQVVWWAESIKRADLFCYEIVYGASLIPPITDKDRKVCQSFRQKYLHFHPEATDDLNAIESRRKAAQKRFEERRKRREREKDLPDFGDGLFGDEPLGDGEGLLLEPVEKK